MNSKTYITSDLHFGHANIMKFCPKTRGQYESAVHMDEMMIQEWNSIVNPDDTVYILGDVAFCDAQKAATILQRLNGKKILVEGNHDVHNLKNAGFRACFTEIHQYLRRTFNGKVVCMFHYPIAQWDQAHRGSVHLHGHLHGNTSGLEHLRARDAGYDSTGKIVSLLDDLIADAERGQIPGHH